MTNSIGMNWIKHLSFLCSVVNPVIILKYTVHVWFYVVYCVSDCMLHACFVCCSGHVVCRLYLWGSYKRNSAVSRDRSYPYRLSVCSPILSAVSFHILLAKYDLILYIYIPDCSKVWVGKSFCMCLYFMQAYIVSYVELFDKKYSKN